MPVPWWRTSCAPQRVRKASLREHIIPTSTVKAPAERFTGDVPLNTVESFTAPAHLA
ncbi:hypothetical protein ACWEJQ_13615 [Streptomyces albidoflavus]